MSISNTNKVQKYQYFLFAYSNFAAFYSSFFFSLIIPSILPYSYFYISSGSFFFLLFYPNKEINCFFNISILLTDPIDGKFIYRMVSSPLLTKIGFVWSNWLEIPVFFYWNSFYWKYVFKYEVTCIFFVEQKYKLILFMWEMYLKALENHFLLYVS